MGMKEIGEYLKNRRNELGISLDKAEKDLKIRKKYLTALEEGDESTIPGKTYFIGYLRNYANYLEVDQDFVNQLLDKSEQVAEPIEPEPRIRRERTNSYTSKMKRAVHLKKDKTTINIVPLLKTAMVLILVVGFVFILNQFIYRLRQPIRIVPITDKETTPMEKTMEQEMLEIAQDNMEKEGLSESKIEEVPILTPLPDYEPIEISVTEPIWLKITQDEQILFEGIIISNERILVKTDGLVSLITSSPNKMSVIYSGETLEPESLEKYRMVAYQILPYPSKN